MAILNSIRKRGIFLILIIALALFAFILSDVLTKGGGGQKGAENVATVNGVDIPRQNFMEEVEATQRQLGPNASSMQAMNMVWDRELRKSLFNEQIEKLGLTVEKAQISAAVRKGLATNPTFQNEAGQFDEGKLQEYIATIKTTSPDLYQQWLAYEESTAQTTLQNTYLTMIKGGMISTVAEGERQYKFENDKVTFQYVQVPFTKISDEDVKVTDAEINAYVKKHPKQFEGVAQADIQYVFLPEEASDADINDAKSGIAALLNDRVEFNNNTKTNDSVKGLRRTTDYEEFVNANSDQAYQDRYFFKSELPPSVADSILTLNEGQVYGPFQVDNTLNIVKVIGAKQLPDSAKARHILVSWEGLQTAADVTRTKDEAKKLADSILGAVQKDGAKFEVLAAKYSADGSNKDKGGDLGYFGPGRMVPAFNDFVFDNATGKMGVVETQFGYHVVDIEEQKNMQKAVKLATVTKKIEPSEKSVNEVFSVASNFEVDVQKGKFDEVAKAKNLEVKPVNKIGELDSNIAGIGENRSIVSWAFGNETEVGDVKRFSTPEGYVIAQLTRKSKKGLMSAADASATVTPILMNEKKAKKIREMVKGADLNQIASSQSVQVKTAELISMSSPVIPGPGQEPAVVGAAFGKKAGESTGLIDGKTGVFMVKVTSFEEAPKLDNYASYTNQLNARGAGSVNGGVFNALKADADIQDNRGDIYNQ